MPAYMYTRIPIILARFILYLGQVLEIICRLPDNTIVVKSPRSQHRRLVPAAVFKKQEDTDEDLMEGVDVSALFGQAEVFVFCERNRGG